MLDEQRLVVHGVRWLPRSESVNGGQLGQDGIARCARASRRPARQRGAAFVAAGRPGTIYWRRPKSRPRRTDGLQAHSRAGDVPCRGPRVALGQPAAGLGCASDRERRATLRALRVRPGLAAEAPRGRAPRPDLAEGVRGARPHVDGGAPPPRGAGAPPGAAAPEHPRPRDGRSDDHRVRHRRAEAAPRPEDPHLRGDLVPGLLRAQRGLRPGVAPDPGREGRRPLRRQRPEGLDQPRADRRLDDAARPHRPERARSTRGSPTSSSTCTRRASRCVRSAS